MSDIQQGDRVRWTNGFGTRIGTVMAVGSYAARVQLLDSGELRWPALDLLTRIAPPAAQVRAASVLVLIAEDYDEAMALAQAGSIGAGVEW